MHWATIDIKVNKDYTIRLEAGRCALTVQRHSEQEKEERHSKSSLPAQNEQMLTLLNLEKAARKKGGSAFHSD